MKQGRRASKFICTDCDFPFVLLDPSAIGRNERKYCPKCGDHFAVKVLKTETSVNWSKKELELLDHMIRGEIKLYSLEMMIDRTPLAIESQKKRRMRELGISGKDYKIWSDEEKALGKKCLDGEITLQELIDKTGRTFQSAETFVRRLKKKLKKQGVII